ncbi:MAG: TonB-dependent receptor [Bacteroidota bacterium]
MGKYLLPAFLLLVFAVHGLSQKAVIMGKISDAVENEPLFNVSIVSSAKEGTTTDYDGNYRLEITPGKQTISFYYIGYKTIEKEISVTGGQEMTIDLKMEVEAEVISEVVVSAGKFEQRLSDVTVSMEVMKPAQIDNLNTTRMDDAINYLPGVEIVDTQPSIRGGSGYSFGAGSRVMLLVDDMPLIAPDAGDIKWNFLAMENLSQIEVIKGASSALFGSSAMNGVINIRTAFPKAEPETKLLLYSGIYMNPGREEIIWWGDRQPVFTGANFYHGRKIGQFDVIAAGHVFNNEGYRTGEFEERARFNTNLRYRFKKIKGLTTGVNANFMYHDKGDFFMWSDDTTGTLVQPGSAAAPVEGKRINIDPYITFITEKGDKNSLRTRYYFVENMFRTDTAKDSRGDQYYGEYQYQKNYQNNFHWTSGIAITYSEINSLLFGDHFSSNFSLFSQADKKIGRLSLSLGVRVEYFRIDTAETVSKIDLMVSDDTLNLPVIPVFRAGASYRLAEYTFARASFGQGFRFPSIAEKYTSASVSSLNIFPNPSLILERGWSAEAGIKQGLKISNWNGYLDIAGFWTEYRDMMEYAFGFYDTLTYAQIDPATIGQINPETGQMVMVTLDNLGFQSQNVGHARITGVEAVLTGRGKILTLPATLMMGYVFTNPTDLTIDANDTTRSTESRMLKYRYYHTFKSDLQLDLKKLSLGVSMVYHSFMVNVDDIFLQPISGTLYILPGYKSYRLKHNAGTAVWDFRMAWNFSETSNLSLVLKNAFNKEYMTRPGDVRPPRNIAIQYTLHI